MIDYDDIYDLYYTVASAPYSVRMSIGMFSREKGKGEEKWIVKYGEADMIHPLLIASEKARQTFLKIIIDRYCQDMSIDGFYEYHKANDKND